MENEIKFDENRKKLIRAFRAKVCNGQSGSRVTYLAYAFLRDRKYISLEKKISEDHPSFDCGELVGRWSFLYYLASGVSSEIKHVEVTLEDGGYQKPSVQEIYDWIKQKYQGSTEKFEEKAA